MTKLLNDQGRRVLIQHLIDIRHYPEVHQLLDDLSCFDSHLLRQIAHGDVLGDVDVINDLFCWLLEGMLVGLVLQLFAPPAATPGDTRLGSFEVING